MNAPPLSPLAWLQSHALVARDSLTRLRRNGLSSLITVLMMGCTLSLPTALWVLSENAALAGEQWQRQFSVSLYLDATLSEADGRALAKSLTQEEGFVRSDYLSAADALAEFREYSGFGEALDLLRDNPLPAVIVLWTAPALNPDTLQTQLAALSARPEVELAQADTAWLARLQEILAFGRRLIQVMAVLLGLTVLLVVGNTIRLDIENRREEIVVMKLIGAPDGFIHRPFLYTGTLYGLLSGLVACLSVVGILAFLEPRLDALAALYQQELRLSGLGPGTALRLTLAAGLLGWFGAWQCVRRHLHRIEPE